ncbi:MAG TPA: DUF929 family protein [Candidatus Dormibacteraeota bacterium]|nr:DUF929 family protein [Candidatus Dormibacteraeota bacterium]
MSKKSMAARRQMREAALEDRAGGSRQQSRNRPRGRNYRRNEARRPWGLISAVVGVVVVFVIVVVALEISLTGNLKQDTRVLPAPASLVNSLSSIPVATLEKVGAGNISHPPLNIPASYKATALTSKGLPEVAYVGGEFCPYCALERWSLIVGLSRFGKWSNLHTIRSSVYDTPGNLPTFTMAHGTKFTSRYLVFYGREYQSNVSIHHNGAPYKSLQTDLTPDVLTAFTKIDGGDYPFVDWSGKLAQVGSEAAAANVTAMQGLTWNQVLTQLRNPKSTIAQEILGGANYVTAATCLQTGQQPGAVCSSSMIKRLETSLEASQ